MAIEFKDQAVAVKYTTDQVNDKIHHLPGGKNKNGWKGFLSAIPIEQADRWINRPGQNILKLKSQPPAANKAVKGNDAAKGE
jgi:hypothetical protein